MRPVVKRLSALLGLAGMLAACNDTPVQGLEKSFSMVVNQRTGSSEPVPIDFLWVIDNSTSMCQEQFSLTKSFDQFTSALEQFFEIDPRIAVTTVDANCEPDGVNIFSKGIFNTKPNRVFPPACFEERRVVCRTDDDCANLDCELYGKCDSPGAEWVCKTTAQEVCMTNPNGSINTRCQRTCTGDGDCRTFYSDDTFECREPAGQPTGCLRPPDTVGCPDTLPPVLTKDNIDLFRCTASVGVTQLNCLKYEQQLRSGLLALDPTGRNAEQAKNFLREDAYLVIIFVTDEEDCSVAEGYVNSEGKPGLLETDYNRCGLLPTTDDGGPLVPVAHYVNRFKALKRDPGKVVVATISGDSTKDTPELRALDRQAYLESKSNPRVCHNETSVCNSVNGVADYAPRMIELVNSFGPNGVFSNICSDEGIGPALTAIARTIIQVINKVCLPKPILDGLRVTRTGPDGQTVTLEEGDGPGRYRVVFGSEDCIGENGLLPAIAFGDPPVPGEVVNITYEGDPQFP
jgi:hypothetical protein